MDNLIFTKVWSAEEQYGIVKVVVQSKYVKVNVDYYMVYSDLSIASAILLEYCSSFDKEKLVIFDGLTGAQPPLFSMKILPAHKTGRLKIELDMEIDDNNERLHRCCFYIETELGLLEQFAKNILRIEHEKDIQISLNPFQMDLDETRTIYY